MIWISRINLILFSVSIYLSIYPRTGLHLHDLDQQDESHLIFCIYLSIYLFILELVYICMIWISKMNLILFSVSIYLFTLELVYSCMIWISRMNLVLFSVSMVWWGVDYWRMLRSQLFIEGSMLNQLNSFFCVKQTFLVSIKICDCVFFLTFSGRVLICYKKNYFRKSPDM